MEYVGEVLQEVKVDKDETYGVCIGITPWDIVTDRAMLQGLGGIVKYDMSRRFNTEGAYLDNNHTHFLLVDRYGEDIDLGAALERAITNTKYDGIITGNSHIELF